MIKKKLTEKETKGKRILNDNLNGWDPGTNIPMQTCIKTKQIFSKMLFFFLTKNRGTKRQKVQIIRVVSFRSLPVCVALPSAALTMFDEELRKALLALLQTPTNRAKTCLACFWLPLTITVSLKASGGMFFPSLGCCDSFSTLVAPSTATWQRFLTLDQTWKNQTRPIQRK